MSYYFLIDIVFLLMIGFLSYYFYQNNLYEKLFEYFKIFLFITLSAQLASQTGLLLHKNGIVSADSYSVLILIAFTLNFFILFYTYKYILRLSNLFISNRKIKVVLAKLVSFMEVLIIVTFSLYIVMQLSLSKKYIEPTLKRTLAYGYIKQFYKKFLDYDFVYMIISNDTNINHKEVIFKSLKNSL